VIPGSQRGALPIPDRFGNDDHRQAMKNMNEYRQSARRFQERRESEK
jgi:hypothetical protein